LRFHLKRRGAKIIKYVSISIAIILGTQQASADQWQAALTNDAVGCSSKSAAIRWINGSPDDYGKSCRDLGQLRWKVLTQTKAGVTRILLERPHPKGKGDKYWIDTIWLSDDEIEQTADSKHPDTVSAYEQNSSNKTVEPTCDVGSTASNVISGDQIKKFIETLDPNIPKTQYQTISEYQDITNNLKKNNNSIILDMFGSKKISMLFDLMLPPIYDPQTEILQLINPTFSAEQNSYYNFSKKTKQKWLFAVKYQTKQKLGNYIGTNAYGAKISVKQSIKTEYGIIFPKNSIALLTSSPNISEKIKYEQLISRQLAKEFVENLKIMIVFSTENPFTAKGFTHYVKPEVNSPFDVTIKRAAIVSKPFCAAIINMKTLEILHHIELPSLPRS
jgi:hypothetical protein